MKKMGVGALSVLALLVVAFLALPAEGAGAPEKAAGDETPEKAAQAAGDYVILRYDTSFENLKTATETVVPMKEKDGAWRVSGYLVRP